MVLYHTLKRKLYKSFKLLFAKMDRNHALKNVLQKENWESINKAPERMNTNPDNSLQPLESKSDNEKEEQVVHKKEDLAILHKNEEIMQHNIQKIKETIDTLERIMNTKLNEQGELLNQVVGKMNNMIANYNEIEAKMNKYKSQSLKGSSKKEVKKDHKDTSTMEKEVNPDDVSIEKMFNCSNKKF